MNEELKMVVNAIVNEMGLMEGRINKKIESVEGRLGSLEGRMETVEGELQFVKDRLKRVEVDLLENNVIPRLNTIEACYTSTYNRYRDYSERMETAFTDIDLLKKVVSEHSEKLKKIS